MDATPVPPSSPRGLNYLVAAALAYSKVVFARISSHSCRCSAVRIVRIAARSRASCARRLVVQSRLDEAYDPPGDLHRSTTG